ncbi:MAG: hypothetical protein ACRDTE_29540 [Pseudonocardiaceae bacterium]
MSGPHPIYQDATNAVLVGCLTRLGWFPEQFAYQYVAIADSPVPVREPVHPFGWFAEDELDGLPMFEDTRLLARALFPRIGSIDAAAGHDSAAMLRVLSATGLS